MGLFDKKQSISRREVREILNKDSGGIPGSGGQKFSREERRKIAREVFKPKYGSIISEQDYKKILRDLESKQKKAENRAEREKIRKKKEYLRELGGFENYEI
jgi:hypothetical protein